jgi:hypothetical protein
LRSKVIALPSGKLPEMPVIFRKFAEANPTIVRQKTVLAKSLLDECQFSVIVGHKSILA